VILDSTNSGIATETSPLVEPCLLDRQAHERFHGLTFTGKVPCYLKSHSKPRTKNDLGPLLNPENSPEQIDLVYTVLRAAGLPFSQYRLAPLLRRVPACLRALKCHSTSAAIDRVNNNPEQLRLAVNSMLIGTTSFFRDTAVFEDLETKIIPSILDREKRPKIWSVACSGGEELYSVAMLFASYASFQKCHFLGMDCRPAAVQHASKAIYPAQALESIPAEFAERFLIQKNAHVWIHPWIASRTQWKCGDILTEIDHEGQWDLILCRNLAIYLEPQVTADLWNRLAAHLAPGGYLIVGRAEKPCVDGLSKVGHCTYQKTHRP
jgi:chemotaxis protein methyltransferase CheR